ncbi:MAG: LysR family transcriptional regulator [Patescibacteria group bacterium]
MEDRLYKFARLVDAGSYTKAARLMHISQPALTTAIKKLERELHAELLIRNSHTFKLTAAGSIAYDTAKELSIQARNLKLRLSEAADRKVSLGLGMIDSMAELLFIQGDSLSELERGTHLSLTVDNTTQLLTYVEHDDLDIALIAKPPVLSSSLMAIDLGEEPLILVTHTSRVKEVGRQLEDNELRHFLHYNQNARTHRLISRHFAQRDIELRPAFYSTSPEIMLQLVLAKRGAAVLPYLLVKPYVKQGQLMPIVAGDTCIVGRNIVSIHRAGRSLPDQVNNLLSKTRTQLSQLNAEAKLL